MRPSLRPLALALGIVLLAPAAALATPPPDDPGRDREPTPAPAATATPLPGTTPEPSEPPIRTQEPAVPQSQHLTVGYTGTSLLRQAPLLLAQLSGYFEEAGFASVTIAKSPDAIGDVLSGDLDFAVVDMVPAATAAVAQPVLQAVAGHRNYNEGAYGGDLLLASPAMGAQPGTVVAFLTAYIRALQDLSTPEGAADGLTLLRSSDLVLPADVVQGWGDAVAAYAPFDGGFGDVSDEQGLGELAAYLAAADGPDPELETFIAQDTLNLAQAWLGLDPNPSGGLAGGPGITQLTVGLSQSGGQASPIVAAQEAGYFQDAGFESVEIVDVEAPMLGVLQGELDLGVVDAIDAADGSAQGLPLAVLAGHRNYAPGGAYGGDVLLASTDVLGEEGPTLSAFLIAYLRALRDMTNEPTLAPHDGGFGSSDQGGGLGELEAYLSSALGESPDLDALVETRPLHFAQTWLGLPTNPTANPAPAEDE